MGLIYCTTNLIDNKKYIGKQWDDNKNYYLGSGVYLNRAIKKYGRQNFKKEILKDNITDFQELSYWEKYFINLFDAYNSQDYYNLTFGGDGESRIVSQETRNKMSESAKGKKHETLLKSVNQYDLNGFFIAQYEGVSIACKILGWNKSRGGDIGKACNKTKGVKSAHGYLWEYAENIQELDFCI